ncbi:MAG: polysaccharide deacetylase family protein [bacterium]
MAVSVPVLLYHHVNAKREITPAGFEKQMEFLSRQGYRSIFLDELVSFLKNGVPKDSKYVAITFDDGYLDNWLLAYPILKKYNLKATIFVVTSRIQDTNKRNSFDFELDLHNERNPENFLSWDMMREMGKSGMVSIECHTHFHYKEGESWSPEPNMPFAQEISMSRDIIETKLKKKCRFLAWPWGEYTMEKEKAAQEAGFEGAVITEVGANKKGTDSMRIKRFKVHREDLGWFSKRLSLYGSSFLSGMYSAVYGLERGIKRLWK